MNELRAVLFIDGNNWYHGLRNVGLRSQGALDFRKISEKLVRRRRWIETRYYVGRVPNHGNTRLYDDQRRFISRLLSQDAKISAHFGRLEPRRSQNEGAKEILSFLGNLEVRIDPKVYGKLVEIARRHVESEVMVEKAVDVMMAVDLVAMCQRDEFDVAYLLTADGDFTPAVRLVKEMGKRVFAVSAQNGAELAKEVDTFIPIRREWLDDCFLD